MASTNKLYPPIIDGVLPAFYKSTNTEENKDWQVKIVIPFSMNQMVGTGMVKSMFLRLKTVQTNEVKYCKSTKFIDIQNNIATFYLNSDDAKEITIGLFYKAQLAYCGVEATAAKIADAGYFSTVGIIKCIAKPTVSIAGFNAGKVNFANNRYLGLYEQDIDAGDFNEKVYSYKFVITNDKDEEYITSGVQLHNVNNDTTSWTSQDEFIVYKTLEAGKLYHIQYSVTTVNGIELSSPYYRVMAAESVPMEKPIQVLPQLNYDEGYIEIHFLGPKRSIFDEVANTVTFSQEEYCSGLYLLSRGYVKDNYMVWDEIARFNLNNMLPSNYIERDFTIEQGITYKYRLQQYNSNGIYSQPIYSKEIYADFEDMFLYDGTRQLKVRFNPKVTSFKVDIPEQKLETIGSKYPFIFRNGNVYYHEFPISGLISYQLDEAKLFLNEEEIAEGNVLEKNTITRFGYQPIAQDQVRLDKDLTSENLMSERYFKLKVLEWLTNGEIKLFRSPGEGNYLVRLLNTSMSPNDTLGRMLHTFTTTAYEIDDLTYDNLLKYHMISIAEPDTSVVQLTTIEFTPGAAGGTTVVADNLSDQQISGFEIDGCIPGDQIIIKYADDQSTEVITIGVTGSYRFSENERLIESISFVPTTGDTKYPHYITLEYVGTQQHYFDLITSVTSETIVGRTYYGPQTDIINAIAGEDDSYYKINIKIGKNTETYKTKLLNMEKLHITAREIIPLYRWKVNNNFVYNTTPFGVGYPIDELNSMLSEQRNILGDLVIFKVYQQNSNYAAPADKQHLINTATKVDGISISYDSEPDDKHFYEIYPDWKFVGYWDRHYSTSHFMPSAPDMRFAISKNNDGQLEYIELKDEHEITLTDLGPIDILYLGSGLIAETIMRVQVVDYSIEDSNNTIASAKQNYIIARDAVTTAFNNYVKNYTTNVNKYQAYLAAKAEWDAAQEVISTLAGENGDDGAISVLEDLLANPEVFKTTIIDQLTTSITNTNYYINQFWSKLNNYQDNHKLPSGVILPGDSPAVISVSDTDNTKDSWIASINNANNSELLNVITAIINNPDDGNDLSDYFNNALNTYTAILTNYHNNIPTINNFTDILPQIWIDNWGSADNKDATINEVLTLLKDNLLEMYETLRLINITSHNFNSTLFTMPWTTNKSTVILTEQTRIAGVTDISYDDLIPDKVSNYNTGCTIVTKYNEYLTTIEELGRQEQTTLAKQNEYAAAKEAFDAIYNEQIASLLRTNDELRADNDAQHRKINAANSLIEGLEQQQPQTEETEATIAFLRAVIATANAAIDRNNEAIRANETTINERQNKQTYLDALAAQNNAYTAWQRARSAETILRDQKTQLDTDIHDAINLWNQNLSNVKSYLYILEHFDDLWRLEKEEVVVSINNYNTWYEELRSNHVELMLPARNSLNAIKQTRMAYIELSTKINDWNEQLAAACAVPQPKTVNKPASMNLTNELNNKQEAWKNFIIALRLGYQTMEARYAK